MAKAVVASMIERTTHAVTLFELTVRL